MADVFISYKSEDRAAAESLDLRLRARGYTTWWDTSLVAGDVWTETIRAELRAARVVVVLWSAASWASGWVQSEAMDGFKRNILVAARLDDVILEVPFNLHQVADVRLGDAGFDSVVAGVDKKTGGPLALGDIDIRRDEPPVDADRTTRRTMIESYHARRVEVIEEKYASRIDAAQAALDEISDSWERVAAAEGWRPPMYGGRWLYVALVCALAIAQTPINVSSFGLFFQESYLVALLMSLSVGLVVAFLAHTVGVTLRRFRFYTKRAGGTLAMSAAVFVATLLLLVTCYVLALLRQAYLTFLSAGAITAPVEAIDASRQMGVEGWIFLSINAAIAIVAVLASYYRHDPHPLYELLDRTKRRARRTLERVERQRAEARAAESKRFAAEVHRFESD